MEYTRKQPSRITLYVWQYFSYFFNYISLIYKLKTKTKNRETCNNITAVWQLKQLTCVSFVLHSERTLKFILFASLDYLSRLVFPMTFVFLMSASPSNRVIYRAASYPGSGWVGHFWSPTHFDPLLVTEHNIKWSFHSFNNCFPSRKFQKKKFQKNKFWEFSQSWFLIQTLNLQPFHKWLHNTGELFQPNKGKVNFTFVFGVCLKFEFRKKTSELLFHARKPKDNNTGTQPKPCAPQDRGQPNRGKEKPKTTRAQAHNRVRTTEY